MIYHIVQELSFPLFSAYHSDAGVSPIKAKVTPTAKSGHIISIRRPDRSRSILFLEKLSNELDFS